MEESNITFESLGLSEAMLKALEKKGYGYPTTIQAEAIPYFLQWRDVIAKAPTGTGKTFAFGIPMIEHIDAECEDVQGLILAPTRELAIQIGDELRGLSDRVAILRKGAYVGEMKTSETNAAEMTNQMVGHTVSLNIERPVPVNPKARIEVKGLNVRGPEGNLKLKDVSFTANSGEILGIAGISGCGQKELLEAIAGLQPAESGSISYISDDGSREEILGTDPLKIADLGVVLSFVPEDRLGMGLVGSMDIADNMMLRSFRQGHSAFTDRKAPQKLAREVVDELEVATPGIDTQVRKLSGGNVQKVLVGREIAAAPTVLLTAYAVRGLDINSSYTIYDLINRQKQAGVAVIYVGEDLDVLLELSDRILVLCDGQVSGIVDGRGADKNEVGLMMTKVGGANE